MLVQFNVFQDEDDVWCASAMEHGVHTQGQTLDELYANIDEATRLHFEDELNAGKTVHVLLMVQREYSGAATAGR